ncbi:MAG: ribonuclease H-like domain-containing protein [Armatimonadota bacterium]
MSSWGLHIRDDTQSACVHVRILPTVAKWVSFTCRETGAEAAMSMLWFDPWLSTGDRSYLEASIRYNEDDCRATGVVKEWLGTAAATGA